MAYPSLPERRLHFPGRRSVVSRPRECTPHHSKYFLVAAVFLEDRASALEVISRCFFCFYVRCCSIFVVVVVVFVFLFLVFHYCLCRCFGFPFPVLFLFPGLCMASAQGTSTVGLGSDQKLRKMEIKLSLSASLAERRPKGYWCTVGYRKSKN